MWKRIGIRGDGSPQQPAGGVQASPLSSSREKYMRKRPLNEDVLRERDLSSSRISEHSVKLNKMASESSMLLDAIKHNTGSKHDQQPSAPNKTEQSAGKPADAGSVTSIKSGRKETTQSEQPNKEQSPPKKLQSRPSVSFGGTYQLSQQPNTDRPSGSSSTRDLNAQADMRQSLPPVTTMIGAENATNEYIAMLDRKRKDAEAKNVRYEKKLQNVTRLQSECSDLKKQVASLKKSVFQSQSEIEKRFVLETTKKIEDEINRRSKLEQEVLRQTQHERDELRAKLKAETEKVNNLKLELEQSRGRMQEALAQSKPALPPTSTNTKTVAPVESTKPAAEETVSQPLQKPKEEKKPITKTIEKASPVIIKEEQKVLNKPEAVVRQPVQVKEEPKPSFVPAKTVITPPRQPIKAPEPVVDKPQPATIEQQPAVKETPASVPIAITPIKANKLSVIEQEKPEAPLQKAQLNTTSLPIMERVQPERQPIRNPVRQTPVDVPASFEPKPTAAKQQLSEPIDIRPSVISKPSTFNQNSVSQSELLKVTKVTQPPPAVTREEPPAYESSISTIMGALSKMKSSITQLSNCKQALQDKASQPEGTKSKRVISRTQKIASP